jgi:flagellar biosynthesis protein FlhA
MIHNVVQQGGGNNNVVLEPGLAEGLFAALRQNARDMEEKGMPAVLVVSPAIRNWMSRAVRFRVNDLTVLSYSEIPDDQAVQVLASVTAQAREAEETVQG